MNNAPYTTDKLISYLMGGPIEVRARETVGSDDEEFRDAIIAKLKAADRVVAEWRAWHTEPLNGIAGIIKAIAEYEGKG